MESFAGDVAAPYSHLSQTDDTVGPVFVHAIIWLLVGISVVLYLVLCLCTCGFYIWDHYGLITTWEGWITQSGAAAEVAEVGGGGGGGSAVAEIGGGVGLVAVEVLKSFKFARATDVDLALECAICLAKFKESVECRLIPKCAHIFHADCIDKWLCTHATCPLCRGLVATRDVEEGIA